MLKAIAILVVFCGVTNAMYNYPLFKSCKELLDNDATLLSGLYWITTRTGSLQVYCDMAVDGGGYTFLPRTAIRQNNFGGVQISDIFKQKDRVLLRYQHKDGSQPSTILRQLTAYAKRGLKFSVMKNSHDGYKKPINVPNLGPYLYPGVLPASVARARSVQGFSSNGQDVTFRNCDSNPNSYFAFFPNHKERVPSSYGVSWSYESQGVAVEWRKTGKRLPSHRTMPNDFFFLTELHFGGCGTFSSSDRWRDARGTAIGLR